MLEALAPLMTVIRHFQPNAVRILEKGRDVVVRIFRIKARRRGFDAGSDKPIGRFLNIVRRLHPQAEMMQVGRIRLMIGRQTRRSQHDAEQVIKGLLARMEHAAPGLWACGARKNEGAYADTQPSDDAAPRVHRPGPSG